MHRFRPCHYTLVTFKANLSRLTPFRLRQMTDMVEAIDIGQEPVRTLLSQSQQVEPHLEAYGRIARQELIHRLNDELP